MHCRLEAQPWPRHAPTRAAGTQSRPKPRQRLFTNSDRPATSGHPQSQHRRPEAQPQPRHTPARASDTSSRPERCQRSFTNSDRRATSRHSAEQDLDHGGTRRTPAHRPFTNDNRLATTSAAGRSTMTPVHLPRSATPHPQSVHRRPQAPPRRQRDPMKKNNERPKNFVGWKGPGHGYLI